MIKKFVGRVFGFDREIEDLEHQVEQLSWDSAFGMWTRGAFVQFCQVMPRGFRIIAFIDLDRIHHLNEEVGYTEVDRRVKAAFAIPFRRSDVVARWFSGDEIVILFDSDRSGVERKLEELEESAREQDLTFKFEIGAWEVGLQLVQEVVDELTEKMAKQQTDSDR